jgi:Ca2+-binding RTX toxin-like protein
MSFRSSFQLVLFCLFFLATLTPGHTTESIVGSDGADVLQGGDGDDELRGGNGNDKLLGGNGDDLLRGGDGDDELRGGSGDDELRGGSGDDVLYGGIGIDRLYGGSGADRFVFEIDSMDTDEVMDFNPSENDTVWLQRKYTNAAFTADNIRVDREGDLEVQLANENWSSLVNLHQNNLDFDIEEFTEGLRLRFIKRF